MSLNESVIKYIDDHKQEAYDLLVTLAQIPAPSHNETLRAEFCKKWLEEQGAEGVYIDEALNVVYPLGCTESNPVVVFMAHTDVVFPDTTPLPLKVEDGKIFCPGIGDDSANVAALMTAAKYIAQNKLMPKNTGVVIVLNSCEEGLGNLKGSKHIMSKYGTRVQEFVSFDGTARGMCTGAVGSKRYEVEILTEGGHSYGAFGNRNAIAYMASLISSLYDIKVPTRGRTTYNVGTISGGTSVNTIAQQATMLYEFRSNDREDLAEMETHFNAAIEYYRSKGITVNVNLVGDRPCASPIDPEKHQVLISRALEAVKCYYNIDANTGFGSTDCNTPLSMGIPSLSVGGYIGAKAHTREEYLEIDSLHPGLKVIFDLVLHHF